MRELRTYERLHVAFNVFAIAIGLIDHSTLILVNLGIVAFSLLAVPRLHHHSHAVVRVFSTCATLGRVRAPSPIPRIFFAPAPISRRVCAGSPARPDWLTALSGPAFGTSGASGSGMKTTSAVITGLSAAGVAFAGYLSAQRFFANSCAFGETCPTFLAIPACYVGLTIFVVLLATSILGLVGRFSSYATHQTTATLSLTGFLVAASAGASGLHDWWFGLASYKLGLPACTYGAFVFALIFALSLGALIHHNRREVAHA